LYLASLKTGIQHLRQQQGTTFSYNCLSWLQTPETLVHFPIEVGIGSVKINAHLLMETMSYFLGYRLFAFLRKRQQDRIPDRNRVWIIIGAAAGGLIFSRLIGALEDPGAWAGSAHPFLFLYASKTIIGGLLGGLLGVELIKKIIGERSSSGDLFTYPLMFALAIGRLGCFSMGVHEPTFGIPSNMPWAMDLGDGIPRHPVALYEIVFLGLLAGLLLLLERRFSFRSGLRFQFFMIAYLLMRLCIEFIKPSLHIFLGLGTIQMVCILGLAYYGRTLWQLLTSPQKLLADVA
jgi:phosphatidylglycerol---prolipoprotein diacylglyceryl transferase